MAQKPLLSLHASCVSARLTRLALAIPLMFYGTLAWQATVLAQTPNQASVCALQARHAYAIPAGALDATLVQFVQVSGSFLASTPEQVQGKTSAGVQGQFSPQEALDTLLIGTGLHAAPDQANLESTTLAAWKRTTPWC